jgi:hypothetical protein
MVEVVRLDHAHALIVSSIATAQETTTPSGSSPSWLVPDTAHAARRAGVGAIMV